MTVRQRALAFVMLVALAACGRHISDPGPTPMPPPPPTSPTSAPVRFNSAELSWRDAPPTMPAGAKVALLEGDPSKHAFFTMRLRLPAGARLNPHTHPADERATVISGSVHVAFGEKFDPTQGQTLSAGAFYLNPTPMPHFVWTDEGCVLQVTGVGPWGLNYVDPPK
jgi:quercetin dioxygenase-like cupin family protein